MAKSKASYKAKKRKFVGNRFVKLEEQYKSRSSKKLRLTASIRPKPTVTSRPNLKQTPRPSISKYNDITKNPVGYRLIDLECFSAGVQLYLACKECKGNVSLAETNVKGLGSKILIRCDSCDPNTVGSLSTSKIVEGTNAYEVNRRSIYAMRSIGQGLKSLEKFCGVMNMPPPVAPSTYNLINNQILGASKQAASEIFKEAVLEEIDATESDPKTDLTISGDGTWMRRGYTSLHGVCTIIGAVTGKVLDVEALSSFCHGCSTWKGPKTGKEYETWLDKHREMGNCSKNHFGAAGSMEVEGIKKMFSRSEDLHGVRYLNYIGDGDTSTYPAICDSQPYGPSVSIVKEECVGHVQKRMYTRLKTLKDKNKKILLSDGKKLGGKNRLTGSVINQLCVYYGNAIRGNSNDLVGMRKSIWAIWNHKASTNENPKHGFCPEGPESWCTYQKAVSANQVDNYRHKNTIPVAVMDFIKPIFDDLSKPVLLRRCLKGMTQNANESYNNLLWYICPKRGFAGGKVVKIAAYEAALAFNEGNMAKQRVLQLLKIVPGQHFEKSMKKLDLFRVRDAEKKALFETKEARRSRRMLRLQKNQQDEEVEGVTYAAGQF